MAVELKDFIKTVLSDITGAVSEMQNECTNGAVISPGIAKDMASAYIYNGRDYSPVLNVDFEMSIYGEMAKEENKGLGVAIKVFIAGTASKGVETESNTSKVRFSVPISLPAAHAKGSPTVTEKRNQGSGAGIFQH